MNNVDKLKNILSFLCILFNGNDEIMKEIFKFSPDYIIEKYDRYIKSDTREWPWGMHRSIKRDLFIKWLEKYNVELSEDEAENW